MLRRPPTTLAITAEDVAAYEDRRASEALQAAQQARATAAQAQQQQQQQAQQQQRQQQGQGHQQQQQQQQHGQQQDLTPGQAARRAREERLGMARRAGGR
ncbi:thioredoxin-like protein [Purpureocillium lavendulum]|uniref:Thioredoxin-like protein n=1 Tax=Purpureocillium lavendulum TaxID=1247861 RepID=A0AB34FTS4_9HYPO|nr:thioredoxin-like protein [Purpureocillium lavendulum]